MTDQAIIQLYWNREENAITESSNKYGRYCLCIAKNILFNKEDSEECLNDTWLKTWNSIPPTRPNILRVFLGKITRNLAINMYERKFAQKRGGGEYILSLDELSECITTGQDVDSIPDMLALKECLDRFLSNMNVESRKIFIQRYWYMNPVKAIANEFGYSESKIKMSLLRSRKSLKEELEREGFII